MADLFSENTKIVRPAVERVGRIELPTQPWEGRILPLNHTRLKRLVVYLAVFGLASFGLIQPLSAEETAPVNFTASDVRWGKTLTLPTGAKSGIFPEALTGPADVTWTAHSGAVPGLPAHRQVLGTIYRLEISGAAINPSQARPIAVAIPFGSSNWIRQVWVYNLDTQIWTPLQTSLNSTHTLGQSWTNIERGLYAILEDRHQLEGTASYYCINNCSTSAGQFIAATNAYPIGTKVRVRNLQNGRTINVEIVSTWAGTSKHVIDLHLSAFAALGGTTSQGIIRVNVSPVSAQVLGVTTGYSPSTSPEVIPKLRLVGNNNLPFPTIRPRPFAVFDQTTGQLLAWHRKDEVVPIASITKLMTAAVFLDTKTDLGKTITYLAEDQTSYGYLQVKPGEIMLIRDLFYATLVASANNSATALARSTGLSREEFVRRMNEKAKAWGLGQTRFVDVNGLNPGNVSTAEELARMTAQIFHDYQPIRFVTIKREYSFTTINTGVPHRLLTTDKLLGSGLVDNSLVISGGKTGYLDESKYTYALRAAAKDDGRQIVTVLLGSASSSERFNDAAALTNWAFRNHRWAP